MLNFSMFFKKPSLIYLIKSRLFENPLGTFKSTCKGVLSVEFTNTQKLPSKFLTSFFPLIILWHIQLCIYKAGVNWSLEAVWPLNLLFNLENQRILAFTWWKFWLLTGYLLSTRDFLFTFCFFVSKFWRMLSKFTLVI